MIYQSLPDDAPIRQGDIFVRVPRVDVDPSTLKVVTPQGVEEKGWPELEDRQDIIGVLAGLRSVTGIVISQDCDAAWAEDISLCEARPFHDVDGRDKQKADGPKKWVPLVTQHARVNQKWFYLPADPQFGLSERMAVDFRIPIRVPRGSMEQLRGVNRVGRLNEVAAAHFRERLGEFFRRYPYDEWYPLSREEFEFYVTKHDSVEPFPWQQSGEMP